MPTEVIKRVSLSAQTAEAIRRAIVERRWVGILPGERQLCKLYQVSRPTVQTAVRLLSREGLLSIQRTHRTRILSPEQWRRTGRETRPGVEHPVIFVIEESDISFPAADYAIYSEMRSCLERRAIPTELLVFRAGDVALQIRNLSACVKRADPACCVLLSVRQEIQLWLSRQSLPVLVSGSCHPAVAFPSIDIDYRAVARHAAAMFLTRGHRHVALIIPNSKVAGDLLAEQGFAEGVARHSHGRDACAAIIRHDGSAKDIARQLEAAFHSPSRPTALLVSDTRFAICVFSLLQEMGLRIPRDVSLAARDPSDLFAFLRPQIAHYKFDQKMLITRSVRLLLRILEEGAVLQSKHLIIPSFVPGESVAPVGGG